MLGLLKRCLATTTRRSGWLHALPFCLGIWLVTGTLATAATFNASIDRDTLTLGETATLSLTFSGGAPQEVPSLPDIPNLQVAYIGPSSQVSFINGQVSSTVTHNFQITPRQAGDYAIPALKATVGGQLLTTQPLVIKVLKPNAPPPEAIASGSQPLFVKLVLPKEELFVGENIEAQIHIYVKNGIQLRGVNPSGMPADGLLCGKLVEIEGQRRQVQIGNSAYTVVPVAFSLRALKPGSLTLGPATFTAVIELPAQGRRPGFFDPFGMFGGEQRQLNLASEAEVITALPLPAQNVPPTFNGAVGSYQLALSAGPTNVTAGDPITVKVQITGRGAIDTLTLPEQAEWKSFKTYPPTSKVETADALGLQGTKLFEQVVTPESPEIKALPGVAFTFFDPDQKAYRTVSAPAVPIAVRPGSALPAPTVAANSQNAKNPPPPTQDIVAIKQRLGTVARIGPPLPLQPWFIALQGVPVVALTTAVLLRKRNEALAKNPRLRRRRRVDHAVEQGLRDLRRLASGNKSDEFFATVFRLLQERLGERLDLPATAITEAVIEERLRPQGVPDTLLTPMHDLFQSCNLARYAPVKDSQELAAFIPRLETVLGQLREVEI